MRGASSGKVKGIMARKYFGTDGIRGRANGIITPEGKHDQIQALAAATGSPATRRAIAYRGNVAAAEKIAFSSTATKKLASVSGPRKRKMTDKRDGYTGASHAVGPVSLRKRLA